MRRLAGITTLATLAIAGAYASTAAAHPAGGGAGAIDAIAPASAVSIGVEQHIQRGDERAANRRYASARAEYHKAAEVARAEGRVPDVALRRVANTYYFQGRYISAGLTLETLAKDASEYGELEIEAWALADAAWMYARSGALDARSREEEWKRWEGGKQHISPLWHRESIDTDRVLARLEQLLDSRYLSEDVRREIKRSRLADLPRFTSR